MNKILNYFEVLEKFKSKEQKDLLILKKRFI